MVARGAFDVWMATVAGVIGSLIGSTVAYVVGAYGGRPLVARYGKYVLISMHDLDTADRWFRKYGQAAVFFGRLLPVVRTFISFPAGITRMPFGKFLLFSALGALPWTFALIYVGKLLGDNWVAVRGALGGLDYIIVAVIVALVLYYIYRHVRKSAKSTDESSLD